MSKTKSKANEKSSRREWDSCEKFFFSVPLPWGLQIIAQENLRRKSGFCFIKHLTNRLPLQTDTSWKIRKSVKFNLCPITIQVMMAHFTRVHEMCCENCANNIVTSNANLRFSLDTTFRILKWIHASWHRQNSIRVSFQQSIK